MALLRAMNCIISPIRSLWMASINFSNSALLISMGEEAAKRGLF
jgi:hypothetical protein